MREHLQGNKEAEINYMFSRMNVNSARLGKLNIDELHQGLKDINIYLDKTQIMVYMEKYDRDNNLMLDFSEFRLMVRDITLKSGLVETFTKYCPDYVRGKEDVGHTEMEDKKLMTRA